MTQIGNATRHTRLHLTCIRLVSAARPQLLRLVGHRCNHRLHLDVRVEVGGRHPDGIRAPPLLLCKGVRVGHKRAADPACGQCRGQHVRVDALHLEHDDGAQLAAVDRGLAAVAHHNFRDGRAQPAAQLPGQAG
eukprot:scaffold27721_cov112-Isochrysis_galbana.AAC.2